jgi:glycosyltransferase involved in cell wall biosynthesis
VDVKTRPRLLFLCQTLPYPPDGGVWIRTYHVLRLLARTFDITAMCFERAATSSAGCATDVAAAREALSRIANVEVFRLPQKHSRLRFAWDHGRSVATQRVYTAYLYQSRDFHRRLARHVKTAAFDLVHVDSLDLARYLPLCRHLPVVCVHHDIESDLLARRAAVEPDRSRRAYLAFQSRRMADVEREWAPRVALNVVCSEHDRDRLRQLAPGARVAVVPNGVDADEFQPDSTPAAGIAYVGGTNPAPNLDALNYFCEDILPMLRACVPQVATRWIGRASPEQQRVFRADHGVELTGYVDDVRPLMREAACHIVPLRIGGGTRLKILNAWAMGKAVVSTSRGCEGLAAIDGDNILIRDDPGAFAQAVAGVLGDPALQRRLGAAGRATVERLYSWDAIAPSMLNTYLTVAHATTGHDVPIASGVTREARYEHG